MVDLVSKLVSRLKFEHLEKGLKLSTNIVGKESAQQRTPSKQINAATAGQEEYLSDLEEFYEVDMIRANRADGGLQDANQEKGSFTLDISAEDE